ncbi:hypothetical protein Tco_0217957 [Tanacetum coccineum]
MRRIGLRCIQGIAWDMVENSNPPSTPQVLLSFKENTSPVTYSDEVEETIGLPIKVEPFYETPLEDLALNTCNHDIPLSSRIVLTERGDGIVAFKRRRKDFYGDDVMD